MTESKGALLIAKNNGTVDYVKQAIFSAKRIKQYLDVPVSVITDSHDYLLTEAGPDLFDKIIAVDYTASATNIRNYFDGTMSKRQLPFKNSDRASAYQLSPYKETLLMDTDYIICSDILKNCFGSVSDIMAFDKSQDLAEFRDKFEFTRTSDQGIDFWWATVVFFRKTLLTEIFFNLICFIEQQWDHYRDVYQINNPLFRNDYAFSIAIHIINGFSKGDIVQPLPGRHHYTLDRDVLEELNDDTLTILVEKENYLGQYTAITTQGVDLHVMNKFSLGRIIDQEQAK